MSGLRPASIASACDDLMVHRGRAMVWDSLDASLKDADDPALEVTPDDVLIVRNVGPKGYPGMPEVGNLPLPRTMLEQGVEDMVRISDARMSATSYGTVILHVVPEAAAGGPLAVVRTGDTVVLDVPNRRLDIEVSDDEIAARLADWQPRRVPGSERGWTKLFIDHVTQADEGLDLDFLQGSGGGVLGRVSPLSERPSGGTPVA